MNLEIGKVYKNGCGNTIQLVSEPDWITGVKFIGLRVMESGTLYQGCPFYYTSKGEEVGLLNGGLVASLPCEEKYNLILK